MGARRDSWTKNYDDVEYDLALEQDRMLPSPSPAAPQSPVPPADPAPNAFSRSPRSSSHKTFPSSPLNPSPAPASTSPPPVLPRSPSANAVTAQPLGLGLSHSPAPFSTRPASRGSLQMRSDLLSAMSPTASARGSMILYRRADPSLPSATGTATPPHQPLSTHHTGATDDSLLPPPPLSAFAVNRASTYSTSGDSFISMSSDSKYPASILAGNGGVAFGHGGGYGTERGLVAYAFDPDDEDTDDGEDDWLHDPEYEGSNKTSSVGSSNAHNPTGASANGQSKELPARKPPKEYRSRGIPWRGIVNISTLIAMIAALLALFVVYPMYLHYSESSVNARIVGNTRINSTGQAVDDGFDRPRVGQSARPPPSAERRAVVEWVFEQQQQQEWRVEEGVVWCVPSNAGVVVRVGSGELEHAAFWVDGVWTLDSLPTAHSEEHTRMRRLVVLDRDSNDHLSIKSVSIYVPPSLPRLWPRVAVNGSCRQGDTTQHQYEEGEGSEDQENEKDDLAVVDLAQLRSIYAYADRRRLAEGR